MIILCWSATLPHTFCFGKILHIFIVQLKLIFIDRIDISNVNKQAGSDNMSEYSSCINNTVDFKVVPMNTRLSNPFDTDHLIFLGKKWGYDTL